MQKRRLALLFSFTLGGGLEALATAALFKAPAWAGQQTRFVFLCHFAACLLLVPGCLLLLPPVFRESKSVAFPLFLSLSCPLPVFGPLLILLLSAYLLKINRNGNLEIDYFFGDQIYPLSGEGDTEQPLTRSLLQQLNDPEVQTRRHAILAAGKLDFSLAIPILRVGQQDDDEQVRIFARNALGRIAEALEVSLKAIENPALDLQQQLERLMFVVDHLRTYVELGLVSEGTRQDYVDRLQALLAQSLAAEPANPKLLGASVRFSLKAGDVASATHHLTSLKAVTIDPQLTLPWELELFFLRRDWPALQEKLAQMQNVGWRNRQLIPVYNFWRQRPSMS